MSKKIILIAGPTASGKSRLAIEIAKKIKGEIINADSMQVYKDFSILSSRPSKKDLKKVKHYLYGFQPVKKHFSTGAWLKLVKKQINLCLKNKISDANELNSLIKNIYKKGEQTLLLTIINSSNQRRYLGVKIN